MKKNALWIALAVVLVVAAGVGGYFFGVEQGKTQTTDVRAQFLAERMGTGQQGGQGQLTPGQFPQGQGGAAGPTFVGRGGTIATIKEIQGSTLVVSTAEKELKVQVSADTIISMTTQGSISDLKVGDRITIGGQTEGDTMTATQIQLIPNIP